VAITARIQQLHATCNVQQQQATGNLPHATCSGQPACLPHCVYFFFFPQWRAVSCPFFCTQSHSPLIAKSWRSICCATNEQKERKSDRKTQRKRGRGEGKWGKHRVDLPYWFSQLPLAFLARVGDLRQSHRKPLLFDFPSQTFSFNRRSMTIY